MGAAVLRLAVLPFVGPVREEIGARCAAVGVRLLVADSGAKRAGGGVASAAAVRWVCRWEKCVRAGVWSRWRVGPVY